MGNTYFKILVLDGVFIFFPPFFFFFHISGKSDLYVHVRWICLESSQYNNRCKEVLAKKEQT